MMSTRYRDYRQKMHEHYKTLAQLPWEERLKHIPKDHYQSKADWEFMCKMFESHTFKVNLVFSNHKSWLIQLHFLHIFCLRFFFCFSKLSITHRKHQ